MTRLFRFAGPAAALALVLGLAAPAARAQAPEEISEEGSKGEPLYGYLATGLFAAGILFAVGKTARR
jgi:hypothetical protein